jgi:tripartite-type tricarboxylate transporter receptor subunit TctC
MSDRRTVLKLGIAAAAGLLLKRNAFASDPIRLIVGFAQGGPTSTIAKLIQEPLGRAMGMAVAIDYVTGEGGKRAALEAIRAAPGSRTLLLHWPLILYKWDFELACNQPSRLPRHWQLTMCQWDEDGPILLGSGLKPVAKVTRGMSAALVVREDSALKDRAGLVAQAGRLPLKVAAAEGLVTGMDAFKKRTGADFNARLTDSQPAALDLVLARQADVGLAFTSHVAAHNEGAAANDKLRVLATSGAERAPEFASVPTLAELVGNRKAAFTYSALVFSSAGADTAFTSKATAALQSIAQDPALLEQAGKLRIPLQVDGPQTALETIRRDRRVTKDVYG